MHSFVEDAFEPREEPMLMVLTPMAGVESSFSFLTPSGTIHHFSAFATVREVSSALAAACGVDAVTLLASCEATAWHPDHKLGDCCSTRRWFVSSIVPIVSFLGGSEEGVEERKAPEGFDDKYVYKGCCICYDVSYWKVDHPPQPYTPPQDKYCADCC